jgi:hypothetical protein
VQVATSYVGCRCGPAVINDWPGVCDPWPCCVQTPNECDCLDTDCPTLAARLNAKVVAACN